VVVNGGAFNATSAVSTTVHSLTVNSGGSLGVYINGTTGTASHLTTDTATFNSGAKIGVTISSFAKAEGNYNVLSAGTLTGASNVTSQTLTLPILFNGTITADANDVYVNIARKTAAQLGLTSPQAAAYDAIIANAANYTDLQGSLLQMTTTSELQSQFNGLLPDYAGGGFDFVTRGSRQAAQHISDDSSLFTISNTGVWLEPMVFHATKHDTDSIGYSLTGGGVTLGLERTTAIGNVGVYFDWTTGNVKNNNDQSMHVSNIEFNAFWRKAFGRLYTFARVGYGRSSYRITRTFTGAVDSTAISYSATGNWKGNMLAASGGLSYEMPLSETFKVRPKVSIDAYRLKENGYQETGTDAIILLVDGRKSTAVNATTTLGFSWSGGQQLRRPPVHPRSRFRSPQPCRGRSGLDRPPSARGRPSRSPRKTSARPGSARWASFRVASTIPGRSRQAPKSRRTGDWPTACAPRSASRSDRPGTQHKKGRQPQRLPPLLYCRSRLSGRFVVAAPEVGAGIVLAHLDDRAADRAGAGEMVEQGLAIALADRLLQFGQVFGEDLQHGEHGVAVVEEHVAPHRRVGGGDTGEIAETPGRILDHLALGHFFKVRSGAHDGIGDEVGQVAGHCQHEVVMGRFHHLDFGAEPFPERADTRDRLVRSAFGRGQDAPAAHEQRGKARVGPALLGARDRMGGNKGMAGQRLAQRLEHAGLLDPTSLITQSAGR
jgi:hypothetical protein